MKPVIFLVAAAAFMASGAAAWTLTDPTLNAPPPATYPVVKDSTPVGTYRIPSDLVILQAPDAAAIMLGKRLLDETHRLLPANTGAEMNCNSCHLDGGKLPNGLPYINTARNYPSNNARAGRVISLTERINGCFQRSMNGKPLDPESPEMKAMIAYIDWLSSTVTPGAKVAVKMAMPINKTLQPDSVRGQAIYTVQCASCHGDNGQGMRNGDGEVMFPPLWGDGSFNIGAGMARLFTAAAFIKGNMPLAVNSNKPLGQGDILSDQDALDVAAFLTQQPRPDFAGKVNDWPKGKKPSDARY